MKLDGSRQPLSTLGVGTFTFSPSSAGLNQSFLCSNILSACKFCLFLAISRISTIFDFLKKRLQSSPLAAQRWHSSQPTRPPQESRLGPEQDWSHFSRPEPQSGTQWAPLQSQELHSAAPLSRSRRSPPYQGWDLQDRVFMPKKDSFLFLCGSECSSWTELMEEHLPILFCLYSSKCTEDPRCLYCRVLLILGFGQCLGAPLTILMLNSSSILWTITFTNSLPLSLCNIAGAPTMHWNI